MCFLLALLVLPALPGRAQDAFKGSVTEVERGDQLTVQLDRWKLKVRLHGIESARRGELAELARAWTRARVANQKVQVGVRGTAAKGIVYGDVSYPPGEHNIAVELTEQGLATWAQNYAPNRRDLAAAQERARKAHAGLWGTEPLEVIRLQRLIASFRAARPRPTPKPKATPKATPAPKKPASATPPTPVPTPARSRPAASPWPLVLGVVVAAGLLGAAERVSRDARRLRQRPSLLTDHREATVKVKLRGIARGQAAPLVSIAGRIPGLYIHEVTQVFRDGAWRTTYDETDTIPFLLDDGSGQVLVTGAKAKYLPIRVARFYNDIPVEKWHANSYGGDIRTEVFFIPTDVTVVVYGELSEDRAQPLLVIEGEERRLTHQPVRLAMGLIVAAVAALLTGGFLSLSGAG